MTDAIPAQLEQVGLVEQYVNDDGEAAALEDAPGGVRTPICHCEVELI